MCVFLYNSNTKAQEGFENILLADSGDSKKLLQAYFAPGMEGFINAMNNGWYHTAKVHKPFGFDITVGLSGSIVPSEREFFNIATTLGANSSITSNSATASTFAGPNTSTPMTVNTTVNGENVSADLNFPGGANLPLNLVPAPVAQISVGLPRKFEAMFRLVPKINLGEDNGSLNMFGVGLKKEITDWFGAIDYTPLHISLLAAYTNMNVNYGIDDQNFPTGNQSGIEIKDALTEFNLTAFTVQAIASINLPVFNVYGGIGYNNGSSNFTMSGTYTGRYETGNPLQPTVQQTLNVPGSLDFESSGFMTTLGARLSLGFFKIFGSYTLQEYNAANLGVAISIR